MSTTNGWGRPKGIWKGGGDASDETEKADLISRPLYAEWRERETVLLRVRVAGRAREKKRAFLTTAEPMNGTVVCPRGAVDLILGLQ